MITVKNLVYIHDVLILYVIKKVLSKKLSFDFINKNPHSKSEDEVF